MAAIKPTLVLTAREGSSCGRLAEVDKAGWDTRPQPHLIEVPPHNASRSAEYW